MRKKLLNNFCFLKRIQDGNEFLKVKEKRPCTLYSMTNVNEMFMNTSTAGGAESCLDTGSVPACVGTWRCWVMPGYRQCSSLCGYLEVLSHAWIRAVYQPVCIPGDAESCLDTGRVPACVYTWRCWVMPGYGPCTSLCGYLEVLSHAWIRAVNQPLTL